MTEVRYEISKEDYEKAKKSGAQSIIPESLLMGYGVYSAAVYEEESKYYMRYFRGSSCD